MTNKSTKKTGPSYEADEFLLRFLPGVSEAVGKTRDMIMRLNSTKNQSLIRVITITGESGAGKSHLAQVISCHRRWLNLRNSDGHLGLDAGLNHYSDKYVEIHLPGVPDTLIESELFGHMKGAFTGAVNESRGFFGMEYADILLDEIGDASLSLQSKLLAVIGTGKYRRVGDSQERKSQSRLILATNRDLSALTSIGIFREDLFWRVSEFTLTVPSLREQPENIKPIIRQIEAEFNGDGEIDMNLILSEKDVKWATKQKWPGNIRQLRHAIKQWRFEEGKKAFSVIVQELNSSATANVSSESSGMLKRYVTSRLNALSNGKEEPLDSLNDIVKDAEINIKKAIVEWYDGCKPDDKVIKKMFRANKYRSVQNKMSEWRNS